MMRREDMDVIWDADKNCPGLKKASASGNPLSQNIILS